MGASDLPEPVRQLIVDCIASAAELEMLLLLHRTPARSWRVDEVTSELRISPSATQAGLRSLSAAGLLTETDEAYSFRPRDERRREAIDQLADAYARRRVRVIEFLFQKPSERITLFSDAFKFRRDKDK